MISMKIFCVFYLIIMHFRVANFNKVNGRSSLETAYFGMGCFWGAEANFGRLDGVVRTRVGYAGGMEQDPSYVKIKDHTETVEVQYNNVEISYETLLDSFWAYHNPTYKNRKQYQSSILYTDNEQKHIAEKSINKTREKYSPKEIETSLKPFDRFYQAEEYHQKYWLREQPMILKKLNLSDEQLVSSSLAAKMNAYHYKYGNEKFLKNLQNKYGLTDEMATLMNQTKY